MGVICRPRFDELLEQAGPAWYAGAEAISELAQLADNTIGILIFAVVTAPAALSQQAAQRWGIGVDDVRIRHLGVLSVEPNEKASGAFAKGGFAALENVANSLADRRILQAVRHVDDRRQTAGGMRPGLG